MVSTGIYNGFTFVDSFEKIDIDTSFKTPVLSCIITGEHSSVVLKHYDTNAVAATGVQRTWQVNGQDVNSFRIEHSLAPTDKLYLEIDGFLYGDHLIEYGVCDILQIWTTNDCSNQYHDWQNDTDYLFLLMTQANEMPPLFEEETRLIINENGQQDKTIRLVQKHRIEFYAPSTYTKYFNSLKINSYVALNTPSGLKEIYNIKIDAAEQSSSRYSIFVLTYEYKDVLTSGNKCCEDINIDNILSPETGEGTETCADFSAAISGTETLTVTLSNPPAGIAYYKWYKDNVFLTNAASIIVSTSGNYRVDVKIGNCRATASFYKDNPCNVFDIQVIKTYNEINATESNVPDGETVSYEVIFGGVVVSTLLPYSALATGIYYVKATAGECQKIKGVYIQIQSEDCGFDVDINETATELQAVTDAATPLYLWQLETANGKTTVGTGAILTKTGKGIYWLTVTNGACSKTQYLYIEPSTNIICTLNRCNGTEFTITDIDLLSITNPSAYIRVYINGTLQTYVSGTPAAPNQWGKKVDGKLLVFGTLTNATIRIEYYP